MPTFKNAADYPIEIPLLELRVPAGDTFEVPDEFAAQFETNPGFTSSKTKNPDVTTDPAVVQSLTGPIPTVPAATPDHFSA